MTLPGSFRVSVVLPTSAERLYRSFLDAKEHAAFTGAPAAITARTGGKFSAFDGHVTGKLTELEAHARIAMSWRTKDFPDDAPDSRVEVLFHPATGGTRVTIAHEGLPAGSEERFITGWRRFYLEPMKTYFRAQNQPEPESVPKRSSAPKQAAAKSAKRK